MTAEAATVTPHSGPELLGQTVVLIGGSAGIGLERATFVTGEILHIDGGQAAGH